MVRYCRSGLTWDLQIQNRKPREGLEEPRLLYASPPIFDFRCIVRPDLRYVGGVMINGSTHPCAQEYLASAYKLGGRPPPVIGAKDGSKYRLEPPLRLSGAGVVITSLFRGMQDPLYKVGMMLMMMQCDVM